MIIEVAHDVLLLEAIISLHLLRHVASCEVDSVIVDVEELGHAASREVAIIGVIGLMLRLGCRRIHATEVANEAIDEAESSVTPTGDDTPRDAVGADGVEHQLRVECWLIIGGDAT